jgi:hypothetical protein
MRIVLSSSRGGLVCRVPVPNFVERFATISRRVEKCVRARNGDGVATSGRCLAELNGWILLRCVAKEQHGFLMKALIITDRLRALGDSSEEGLSQGEGPSRPGLRGRAFNGLSLEHRRLNTGGIRKRRHPEE